MDKKRLKLIFVLLIIVVVAFIALRILKAKRNSFNVDSLVTSAVEGTNWPINDVPLIAKEGLIVEDVGEYNCQASISSGVSYDEVRKYLIQLYNLGFNPYEEFGSLNPNRLVPAGSAQSLNEVSWMGQKDNYTISVLWARENSTDEFGIAYEFNLDVNLFIDPGNLSTDNTTNENENQAINFGDLVSGEEDSLKEESTSGETEISSETIISGETQTLDEDLLSGDNTNIEENVVSGEGEIDG
ncbi:MAG: hypothetical protein IJ215_05935 [Clostridia bacterium]|nr:hypothetical protein [Clostridia bacterium]